MFAYQRLKNEYEKLRKSTENADLFKFISRALDDISHDHRCGIQLQRNIIPKEYVRKYGIDNLWKYDLPNAWRLMYSVGGDRIEVMAIILEWCDHKSYERRFGYKAR